MIYMGLDLATKRTGYSVFNDNDLIHFGTIDSPEELHIRDRIKYMGKKIIEIIKDYNPIIVFIEDVPIVTINKKMTSALSWLCILQGYIISILDNSNIEYRLYMPSTWRTDLNLVVQPKIDAKKDTIKYVNDKFNLELRYHSNDIKSDDNTADAIGIACCGMLRC